MERQESAATAMNEDFDAFRGILIAILLSLPFWVAMALLLILLDVLG